MITGRARPRAAALRWPAGALGLLLLLGACAPVEDDTDAAAVDEGAGEEPPEDRELDPDATFRYAYELTPSRLDPHRATISQDGVTLFPAYDRLIHQDPDGEAVPGLAEDWEFSDDGLVLTLNLREEVTFHDGEPFDAEAAALNLDRALTLEDSAVAADLAAIDDLEVIDEHTLDIRLARPSASLVGVLSDRAGVMVSPAAIEEEVNLDEEAVGAGMYRMVEHRPDDITVYERFEDYWDPDAAAAAQLEIHHIADGTTRLNAIRTGEVDATRVPPALEADARGSDLRVEMAESLYFEYFVLNRTRSEFDQVEVRQAISHAIDRQGIVDGVYGGNASTSVQPFIEDYWAYNPDVGPDRYDYDPERAQELLEEAGLPDGFAFDVIIPTGPDFLPVAEAIQSQLAEVGLDVEVQAVEPDTMGDVMFVQEAHDAMIAGWGPRPDPSMTVAQRYTEDGFANPGGHSTDRLHELHEAADAEVDEQERTALVHELGEEVVDQVLEIPVVFPHDVYLYTDDVVGFEPRLMRRPEFRGVGVAQ